MAGIGNAVTSSGRVAFLIGGIDIGPRLAASGYTFFPKGERLMLKRRAGVYAMLILLLSQARALASDILLIHGHIYTGNPKAPWAAALAVGGARIEAVGTDAAILKLRGSHV